MLFFLFHSCAASIPFRHRTRPTLTRQFVKINNSIADTGSKNLGGWREEGRNLVSLERHHAHISSVAVSF